MQKRIPLAVITGQTASGKSALALAIARALQGRGITSEILCCDSMQIYRGLDIGTEKPDARVRTEFPHHGIDLVDADATFSAGDYVREAEVALTGVASRQALPILVGGTGLYLRALTRGLVRIPEATTNAIAKTIQLYESKCSETGLQSYYDEMIRIDPQSVGKIHPNDRYRILRSLAIYAVTGKTWSTLQQEHGFAENPYETLTLAIEWPRKALYERIEARLDRMMERGLEGEVEHLLNKGISPQARSLQGLAYRWFVAAKLGKISREDALNLTKRDSRRFAKRQATWFRAQQNLRWIAGNEVLDVQTQQALEFFAPLLPDSG